MPLRSRSSEPFAFDPLASELLVSEPFVLVTDSFGGSAAWALGDVEDAGHASENNSVVIDANPRIGSRRTENRRTENRRGENRHGENRRGENRHGAENRASVAAPATAMRFGRAVEQSW